MKEIEKVLNDNEKVVWEGKPQLLPFIFGGGTTFIATNIMFLAGIVFAIGPIAIAAFTVSE